MLSEKLKAFWKQIPFVWKSFFIYVLLFAFIFTFFLFLTLHEIQKSNLNQTYLKILEKVESIKKDDIGPEDFEIIAEDFQLIVFSLQGQPLLEINQIIAKNPRQRLNQFQSFNENQIILYNTLINIDDQEFLIQIAKNRETEKQLLSNLKDFFFLIVFSGLFISASLSIPLSKLSLKGIQNMAESAEAISYENLSTRLELSGSGDEFDYLATTLNQMIDRIQTVAESQKKFISNASHELRTPIAVIKGYAQLLTRWGTENQEILKESAEAINKEVESIEALLQDLLMLSRIDSKLQDLKVDKINILPIIKDTLKDNKILYPNRNFSILDNSTQDPIILGDQWLIKGLFRIFTENAVNYSPPETPINYTLLEEEESLNLFIIDHGNGIPDDQKEKVFQRFYRMDESRTRNRGGSGLGLAIAKRVIELHKGTVSILDTPKGGTTIKLSLPLAEPLQIETKEDELLV